MQSRKLRDADRRWLIKAGSASLFLSLTACRSTSFDVAELAGAFGPERAVDLIWYTCWCNYMTRVADGFQLPLEKENPFGPPPEKKEK